MGIRTRRQVFSGVTALAVAAVAGDAAVAQATASGAVGPFLVREPESRADGPWIIAGKDPLMAKISGADTAGRYSTIEITTPPGRGPALHIHPAQNEWFFLLHGSIGLVCGKEKTVLKVGDSFMAPMGVPHAYVTLGTESARILNLFDPAGQMEDFFKEYARALSVPGPPDGKLLNALSEQHGMKMVGPPVHAADFAS